MQKMFRNGPFAVCQSLQKAIGRPGTYGLNLSSSKSDTFSQVIKFSTGKEKSFIGGVRGDKHSLDAGIHSHNATCRSWFWDFFFITKDQIKFFIDLFKFRVLPAVLRNIRMVHGNALTPKGNAFSGFIEVPFPDQRKSGIFKNSQFPSFIGLGGFISCGNMLANTAGKLTGKIKFFSERWVVGLGESIRVHFFGIESQRRKPVQGLEIVFDYFRGLGRAFNFNFGGSDDFHYKGSFILM